MIRKKRKLKTQINLLVCLAAIFLGSILSGKVAQAESATVSFEVVEENILVGDQVTISLNVDTKTILGDFEGNITYNADILEYVSGPTCITGADGMLRVQDIDASSSYYTRSYVMTFKALNVGSCEFNMLDSPSAYSYENPTPMSISISSKTVEVKAPATFSNDCDLGTLKLSPGTITPTFSPEVTQYSTIVDSETTRLVLSALASDANASVEITGNEDFVEGRNDVIITVTAESGVTKEYKISVVKESGSLAPTEAPEEEKADWDFTATNTNGTIQLHGKTVYSLAKEPEGLVIPSEYTKSSIRIDGYSIPVYQLKAGLDDDYLLLVLENQFGTVNLYRYDRVEKTIQRYTGDRVIIQDNSGSAQLELSAQKKKYESKQGKLTIVIVLLSSVCIMLLIAVISLILKYKNKEDDDFI